MATKRASLTLSQLKRLAPPLIDGPLSRVGATEHQSSQQGPRHTPTGPGFGVPNPESCRPGRAGGGAPGGDGNVRCFVGYRERMGSPTSHGAGQLMAAVDALNPRGSSPRQGVDATRVDCVPRQALTDAPAPITGPGAWASGPVSSGPTGFWTGCCAGRPSGGSEWRLPPWAAPGGHVHSDP